MNYKRKKLLPSKLSYFKRMGPTQHVQADDSSDMPDGYSLDTLNEIINSTIISVNEANEENVNIGLWNALNFFDQYYELMDTDSILIPFSQLISSTNYIYMISDVVINSSNPENVKLSLDILTYTYILASDCSNEHQDQLIEKIVDIFISPKCILDESDANQLPQATLFGLFGTKDQLPVDLYNDLIHGSLKALNNICLKSNQAKEFILSNSYHITLGNDIMENKLQEKECFDLFISFLCSLIHESEFSTDFLPICEFFLESIRRKQNLPEALDGMSICIPMDVNVCDFLEKANFYEILNSLLDSNNADILFQTMQVITFIFKYSNETIKQNLKETLKWDFWAFLGKSKFEKIRFQFCHFSRKIVKYYNEVAFVLNEKSLKCMIEIVKDCSYDLKRETVKALAFIIPFLSSDQIQYFINEHFLEYVSDFITEVNDKFLIILLNFLLFVTSFDDKELHKLVMTEIDNLQMIEQILAIEDSDNEEILCKSCELEKRIEDMEDELEEDGV